MKKTLRVVVLQLAVIALAFFTYSFMYKPLLTSVFVDEYKVVSFETQGEPTIILTKPVSIDELDQHLYLKGAFTFENGKTHYKDIPINEVSTYADTGVIIGYEHLSYALFGFIVLVVLYIVGWFLPFTRTFIKKLSNYAHSSIVDMLLISQVVSYIMAFEYVKTTFVYLNMV